MIYSMTAFASRTGTQAGVSWVWEARSVNARGLDLRLRLPDGLDALEADLRKQISARFKRGNVSVSLRLTRDTADQTLAIDETQLDRVLKALDQVQERAFAMGVTLGQPTAADVLGQRGVILLDTTSKMDDTLTAALSADVAPLLDDLRAMRATEGRALAAILSDQLAQIADLLAAATTTVKDRRPHAQAAFQAAMARVLGDAAVDPDRLAQEMAVLAVKSDVTEELDRLTAHVAAAREVLADTGEGQGVGRRLDFLSQEFNREANTLCAKSQFPPLTEIGVTLKTVIDQMREQIQNVE